jgi:hypothetical protein
VLLTLILVSTSTTIPSDELSARLDFLEERLEAPRLHARVWWWGWLSFYSAGAVAQGVRIALVDPADEDAAAQRADLTVSMVKAIGGVISLVALPLNAMDGAEEMRRVEGIGPEADLLRLYAGEEALEENARESERSFSWLRHALLVAVNVAGGLIIWLGYDDLERAAINTGVGIAIGELAIWTQPWEPRASYREYQAYQALIASGRSEARTRGSQAISRKTPSP